MIKKDTDNLYSLGQNYSYLRKTTNKFLINSVISMFFVYAASLTDTLLVGAFIGEDGLAAMSLIGPVYLVYYMFGAIVGIGSSICAGRALGQENIDEYRRLFTCATRILLTIAAVMTAAGYCFQNTIMKVLCGSVTGVQAELARQYYLFYIPGGAATLMAYVPLYFLRVDGKPKLASRFFLMSGAMNVVLSWLLMSPAFNMGIAGASLATGISFFTVAVAGFIALLKGHTELKFVNGSFSWERFREIVAAGFPTGLGDLLESSRILLINILILSLGATTMLTCFTVVRNVSDVLNAIIAGIAVAVSPLFGVFYGERNHKDTRIVFRHTMVRGFVLISALTVIICVFTRPICSLFGVTDPEIVAAVGWAMPLANFGHVFCFVNQLYIIYLTSIKREKLATILVVLRLLVLLAAFAVPLSRTMGTNGIWLSLSLAEIACFAIFCIIRGVIRHKNPETDRFLLDTKLERDDDISFSVKNEVGEIVTASEKITLFCKDKCIDRQTSEKVSHAIEEILVFLLKHCLEENSENHVAVRVCKADGDVIVRFRYIGKVYNPIDYYRNNAENSDLYEELLGLKMIVKAAKKADYQLTLGLNNVIITF